MENHDDLKGIASLRNLNGHVCSKIRREHLHPSIIAMKGDPYTGKTTCANIIAKCLKCPVISLDDVLDRFSSLAPATVSPSEEERLTDLAFDVVLQFVMDQVAIPQTVIIDSPLTNPRHLDQFLNLQALPSCNRFRFLIVECVPENHYVWETRFKELDDTYHSKWYKPKGWDDARIQSRLAKDVSDRQHHHPHFPGHVSRLVVHTYGYAMLDYLGPAAIDSTWCTERHDFHFCEWSPLQPFHQHFPTSFCCWNEGLHLWQAATNPTKPLGDCKACQKPILQSDDAYACRHCQLALHTPCAALRERMMIPSNELPSFLRRSPPSNYSIPEQYRHRCSSCEKAGKEFSMGCAVCLWETHLRSGLVPTVIHPNGCRNSKIFFWITSTEHLRRYICKFCGLPGEFAGYMCLSSTVKFCFHVECALLPNPVTHTHGGYTHEMELKRQETENAEDYLCGICEKPRNPHAFSYYCDQCEFTSHTYCVFEEDQT